MSVLDRKIRRDLRAVRTTLAAILGVIAVGVACFVGMTSVYVNLDRAAREYYAHCRMADFWIDLKKVPLAEVDRVAALPGVAEVQPRVAFTATIDLESAPKPLTGEILSLPEAATGAINGILLLRGSGFTGERLEEVIVNDAFARAHRIHPGDTIHVLLNNRRQELYVVGTAMSSEFVYLMSPGSLIPDPTSYGVFYVRKRFAEEVLDFSGACNQIVGLATPELRERPQRLLDEIETMLEPYGVFAGIPRSMQSSHQMLTGELAELRASAVILPAIFLATAIIVLNILMSRVVEQQRTTIGTLKALGYTDGALVRHYMRFGLLIGALGGVLGTGAGWALALGTTVSYRQWFELPRLENRIVPWVYGAAIVVGMGFALLGTLRGLRLVLRLDPAEAMRARPPVAAGGIWLERYRRLWTRLGFRWQMVTRSVWRHKWRSAAGAFAAMLGSALMFVTFYFVASMEHLVEFQFEKVMLSDFDIRFQDELDEGALREMRALPGVDEVEPMLVVPCEFENGHRSKRSAVSGLPPGARLSILRGADGEPVGVPSSGLLMDRYLADSLGVRAGDTVTITPIRGRREPRQVTVERTAESFVGLAAYAEYGWLNNLVDEEAAISAVQVKARRDLDSRLALYRALKALPAIQAVTDIRDAKNKLVTTLLEALRYSISILIGMAGAIFLGSILTTSLIAIAQRQREVATLITIGYERRQVGGIFLRESLLINVAGAAAGLPVGLALSVWLITEHGREAFRFPVIASPSSYAITMALAVAFTLLAHAAVQRAINRLDVLEAINAKE